MRAILRIVLVVLILAATSHRAPAPISEESPTPAPKPKAVAKAKPTPQAGNPLLGTWNLNESESTLAPGTGKNTNVFCRAAGDSVRITADAIDGLGRPAHTEWTGTFDGRDYPVVGYLFSESHAYSKINDHTFEMTIKESGKITAAGQIVVSADGRRVISTLSGMCQG